MKQETWSWTKDQTKDKVKLATILLTISITISADNAIWFSSLIFICSLLNQKLSKLASRKLQKDKKKFRTYILTKLKFPLKHVPPFSFPVPYKDIGRICLSLYSIPSNRTSLSYRPQPVLFSLQPDNAYPYHQNHGSSVWIHNPCTLTIPWIDSLLITFVHLTI